MKPVGATFPGTEAPMLYGPKMDDESWMEYFIRIGVANPAAAQAILAKASQILDPKTLNELISAFANRTGGKKVSGPSAPQPQAPKQMGWQNAGGAPPPAPVQNPPQVASAPQAPAPQAPQAPQGWIPRS